MRQPTELGWLPLALCIPAVLAAQGRDWEFHRGRWYNGNRSDSYELRTSVRGGGPFTHGFGAQVFLHDSLGRRRAFYGLGYELQAFRGRSALGPYALAGVALGLSTDTTTQELAAQWSIGGGLEWRPFSRFALGAEARYRVEDRGPRGFWRTSDARQRRCPPSVRIAVILPERAQRVTVLGFTRNRAATSDGVRSASGAWCSSMVALRVRLVQRRYAGSGLSVDSTR